MMEEDDPRVKELQDLAWSLQTLSNKPGSRLPEAAKRKAYSVTSKALSLCSDAPYLEQEDFLSRAAALTKLLQAEKEAVKEAEEAEIARLQGKCFKADGGGSYSVASRAGGASSGPSEAPSWRTTAVEAGTPARPQLTAAEVAARCTEDPEALWLSGLGLRDSDLTALCDGLRRGGASLTCLDVSYNELADAGLQRLVGALASGLCPKLRELWVTGNPFGELGEKILQNGLKALRKDLVIHTQKDEDKVPAKPSAAPEAAEGARLPAAAQELEAPASPSARPSSEAVVEVDGAKAFKVEVPLPEGVESADAVELNISATRLVATALGAVLLDVTLPSPVDPSAATASFSKKKRLLTVTLPRDPQ